MDSDTAGGIEQELRRRWAAHRALPQSERDAIDAKRLVPVNELVALFNQAKFEDWFGTCGRRIPPIQQEERCLSSSS